MYNLDGSRVVAGSPGDRDLGTPTTIVGRAVGCSARAGSGRWELPIPTPLLVFEARRVFLRKLGRIDLDQRVYAIANGLDAVEAILSLDRTRHITVVNDERCLTEGIR